MSFCRAPTWSSTTISRNTCWRIHRLTHVIQLVIIIETLYSYTLCLYSCVLCLYHVKCYTYKWLYMLNIMQLYIMYISFYMFLLTISNIWATLLSFRRARRRPDHRPQEPGPLIYIYIYMYMYMYLSLSLYIYNFRVIITVILYYL